MNERAHVRQNLVNQLFYTYRQLQRVLPKIVKRLKGAAVGTVLADQARADQAIAERLWHVATEQGLKPKPCICKEASLLLEDLQATGHALYCGRVRPNALIAPMKALRSYLLQEWNTLIETLTPDGLPVSAEDLQLRKAATSLQHEEAELHRQLIAFHVRAVRAH